MSFALQIISLNTRCIATSLLSMVIALVWNALFHPNWVEVCLLCQQIQIINQSGDVARLVPLLTRSLVRIWNALTPWLLLGMGWYLLCLGKLLLIWGLMLYWTLLFCISQGLLLVFIRTGIVLGGDISYDALGLSVVVLGLLRLGLALWRRCFSMRN